MSQNPKPLKMAGSSFLRQVFLRTPSSAAVSRCDRALASNYYNRRTQFTTAATSDTVMEGETNKKKEGKWLTLPPFTSTVDGAALGKEISGRRSADSPSTTTALKWVMKCCPQLPRSLVQKLFRLRQV